MFWRSCNLKKCFSDIICHRLAKICSTDCWFESHVIFSELEKKLYDNLIFTVTLIILFNINKLSKTKETKS